MEKTHYQARAAYFRHTQHGGGMIRANSFKQLYYWFYRRILHRARKEELTKQKKDEQSIRISKMIQQRRQRWKDSSAEHSLTLWRTTRQRQNKRWIPHEGPVIPLTDTYVAPNIMFESNVNS